MKRNHFLHNAFACLLAALLGSCDPVGEEDRLIYVPPAEVNRSVLIEDFTGQRCINCPTATEEIEKLRAEYGEDAVIPVAIHSGPFGHRTTMTSARLPLCTETGDEYYKHWNITSQPGVKINRGEPVYSINQYATEVRKALAQKTPLDLTLVPQYDPTTRTVAIAVEAMASEDLSGKLQVWVTENNIVESQMMPDGTQNTEYRHQHVFRTSATADIYGADIALAEGIAKTISYQVTLDEAWKADDISIVAFVSNDAQGVLQVVQTPLKTIE